VDGKGAAARNRPQAEPMHVDRANREKFSVGEGGKGRAVACLS
jgi:hypothetical protein